MQKVITGTIHQGDFQALTQLMRDQSSCRRYAYQRIHKDGLTKANDVVKACKTQYMDKLNQRYIQDAVLRAKAVHSEHALFGGKRLWKKLLSKLVTKDQWHEARDGELYSRGDASKQGNPNIRVIGSPEGYRLRVGLPGRREFLFFKLYIPEKFQHEFELYRSCYDARIKAKGEKFYVYIGLTIPDERPVYRFKDGAIGVDMIIARRGLGICERMRWHGQTITHCVDVVRNAWRTIL